MTAVRDLVTWDGHSAAALAEACGVPRVELYAEVDSTLDIAHTLAAANAPASTLVLADCQRAGRGRMGRSWSSAPDRGVWCTLVERPHPSGLDVLSIRVGLAIASRLDRLARERVGLKWPNDLGLAAGKVGGVLAEARWSGPNLAWVAIGVGVNVLAPDVAGAAALPPGTPRIDVLRAIVAGVRAAAAARGALDASELDAFRERDTLRGRRLEQPARGVAEGITAAGALLVRATTGIEEHRTGTVQLAEGDRT